MNINEAVAEQLVSPIPELLKRIAELEAERDRLLADNVALTKERDEAVIRENDLANKYTAHPSHCPVTGRPFFMAVENESGEMVATYGGPFDSYTIPGWSVEDQEFRSQRYDHDAGYWVEGGEPYALLLVDEDEYNDLTAERDQLREQLAAANDKLELAVLALSKREPEPLTETRTK